MVGAESKQSGTAPTRNLDHDASVAIGRDLSHWIDLFRWAAAFAVVLTHAGNVFVTPVRAVPPDARNIAQYAYAFVMGFSHQGIMIFFVISGFLVGGTAMREARRSGDVNVGQFLARRLIRLWIVILPAIAATFLMDRIGHTFSGAAMDIYAGAHTLSSGAAVCNLLFVQTVACDPYGSDGALWTLYNEFSYYLIWVACLILTMGRNASLTKRMIALAYIVIAAIASLWQREGSPMLPYFPIWLLGMWAATSPRPLIKVPPLLPLIATLALLLAYRTAVGLEWIIDGGMFSLCFDALTMALFATFLSILRFRPWRLPPIIARPSVLLAGFSFTLYCFHLPMMYLIAAWTRHHFGSGYQDVASGSAWLRLGVIIAIILVSAFAISRLTEANTEAARRLLLRQDRKRDEALGAAKQ